MPWKQFFVLQELDSQIDHLREELHLSTLLADEKTSHLDSEIARARGQVELVTEQITSRESERAEAAALIPRQFLAYYEQLRGRLKSRPWVVSLFGTSCPACNIVLPSKTASDAQRTGEPVACPSCSRLLIWRKAS